MILFWGVQNTACGSGVPWFHFIMTIVLAGERIAQLVQGLGNGLNDLGSILERNKMIHSVKTGCGAYPGPYPIGTAVSSLGTKAAR